MNTPKGTRAFYPSEAERRRAIQGRIESAIRRYGFSQIETPAMEDAAVYAEKSGDEIVEQLFLLDDSIGSGQLSLTPELTPTVGKMVASQQQGLKQPVKWYSTRRFWRYEEPQQGRFREFWQTNLDVFGVEEPAAEAELLRVAVDALRELGITEEQVEIRISDRRVLETIVTQFVPAEKTTEVMRIVDKREKLDEDEYREQLVDAGVEETDAFNDLLEISDPAALVEQVGEAAEPLATLFQAVDLGDWLSLDVGTARGLDYYTGIVFEAFDKTGAINRSLLGGGRYDGLVEEYGGSSMPAVGFAFGYATLEEALEAYEIAFSGAAAIDAYVIRFDETASETSDVAASLRQQGYRVEEALTDRSIGSQFGLADARDATYAIVPGPDEVAEGTVTVQQMESGEEVTVPLKDIGKTDLASLFED